MRPITNLRSLGPVLLPLFLHLFLAACGSGDGDPGEPANNPPRIAGKPNIVLFTVDTLRADHLSCYDYWRETSPQLDALAAEGVLCERAYAVMGTTLPSHLSIMTGLYPHQHGYVANHGAMAGGFRSGEGRRAVAEYLRDAGYTTAAFVSGPTVSAATGLDAGFDHFDEHEMRAPKTLEDQSRRSAATTDVALEWLASAAAQPFFLWIHYWDPHEPNIPLEPFASTFQNDEELERMIDERRIRPEVLQEAFTPEELARLFAPELFPALREGQEVELPPIDREAVRRLINLYDGDVFAIDTAVGRVLSALREAGLYDEAILIFTSDHGQALGQHDWLEHGRIQGENLHVPMILRFPDGVVEQPQRVTDVISSVDLFPTLFARLEEPLGAGFLEQASGEDWFSGRYIRDFAFSQRSVRDRDWEPGEGGDGLKFALTTPRWKYYYRPDGEDELYDLSTDPGEFVDVAGEHPDLLPRLRRHVTSLLEMKLYTPELSGDLDSEEARRFREALDNLGYTGK